MLMYADLIQKPRVFKSVTGLDIAEFERLFQKFLPKWLEQEHMRLDHPNRKRAVGAGRKYTLELKDRLVMVLCWLRLYLNPEALGFFFWCRQVHCQPEYPPNVEGVAPFGR